MYTAKFMEEEQELLSDLAEYHDAEQLAVLNITKKSHVKKLLKQAKKQREKLGLPERVKEDTRETLDQKELPRTEDTRSEGVPEGAVNIMEDIQRREAERKAQEVQVEDTYSQHKTEEEEEQVGSDQDAGSCEESSDYAARVEAVEEVTHRATKLHAAAKSMSTVRECYSTLLLMSLSLSLSLSLSGSRSRACVCVPACVQIS
eukprot:COSAG02_NODE_1683_length_11339_cov_976.310409_6_plen_203_part_00